MARTLQEFCSDLGIYWRGTQYNESDLPCFAHRRGVDQKIMTSALIHEYVRACADDSKNDVLVFSVTERDGTAWTAWAKYAKAHPRTFKVVQGGSIHGNYQCRMYIYTKPKSKRKYG